MKYLISVSVAVVVGFLAGVTYIVWSAFGDS